MAEESNNDLAQLLGNLAVTLEDQLDTESTLREIVEGAVHMVPGARWAGILMIQGRDITSRVPTDQRVAELDQAQSSLGEGPCMTALRDQHTVLIDDMTAEGRWPRFAKAAIERGVRTSLSFQLFVRSQNLGALNLYGGEPGVFDDDSVLVGEVLAQHASVALVGAAAESQFQAALSSRDSIGQAKGILMHSQKLSGLRAFQVLLKASQDSNMKLIDVARWVVEDHESAIHS